jgi:tetratricopeptide (TPR) repeat protein
MKTIILVAALIGITAFFVFPHIAPVRSASKSSRISPQLRLQLDTEKLLGRRVTQAMQSGSVSRTEAAMNEYLRAGCGWNFFTRYDAARFYASKHAYPLAKEQLDYILNPPPGGTTSDLAGKGSVISLWLVAAQNAPATERKAVLQRWYEHTEDKGDGMGAEAKAEYLYAGEVSVLQGAKQALPHYEKAAALAPGSAVAWQQLGAFRRMNGDQRGAREAFAKAYVAAPLTDREKYRRMNGTSDEEIRKLRNP